MAHYNIRKESTLHLMTSMRLALCLSNRVIEPPISLQITIKTLTRIITLEALSSDTIETLKSKIQDKEGFPRNQQCLIARCQQLGDKVTVADILPDTVLHLVLRRSRTTSAPQPPEQAAPEQHASTPRCEHATHATRCKHDWGFRHVQPPDTRHHPGPDKPFNCASAPPDVQVACARRPRHWGQDHRHQVAERPALGVRLPPVPPCQQRGGGIS